MESTPEAMDGRPVVPDELGGPGDLLEAFTGGERILAVLPFVADIESTPCWHHLLFTEDKILAVPAYPEPAAEAHALFFPRHGFPGDRYPSVHGALNLVAVPEPLGPSHVTAIVPYRLVRLVRLSRGHGGQTLPELEIQAGRKTTWWFLQREDGTADEEKACYARDLLLSLLPFPVQLVGFSETPRPSQWHLRRGLRQPLPLLVPGGNGRIQRNSSADHESERHG